MAANYAQANRYNPFRPGSPTPPGMFAGRLDEMIELHRILVQTKHGNATHFLVTGERGIGKSSLMMYLSYVARGDIKGLKDTQFRFLVVEFDLESEFTQIDILHRLGTSLRREIGKAFKVTDFAKGAWSFISRWEVLGVKYQHSSDKDLKAFEVLDEVASLLGETSEKLTDEGYDGILILIDEADKAPIGANLGQVSKNLTERLAKSGVNRVTLGLAGLPDLVHNLRSSHESSPRIFKPLVLDLLKREDCIDVVRKGLAEISDAVVKVEITEEAELELAKLSEGYPSFVQQFAYCAFEADTDNNIDIVDVAAGVAGKGGAIEELGKKYFADLYFEQIGSDDYRKVLHVMARHEDAFVSKKQIRLESKLKETTLTNAISVLITRKIIRPQDGKAGWYRLPTKSFAAWLRTQESAVVSGQK